MPKILIVQPWFSAVGHPAQSLINTAKTIGARSDIAYMISGSKRSDVFTDIKEELQKIGNVIDFSVRTDSLREGTLKALVSIRNVLSTDFFIDRILFLDANLILLAILWPFFYQKRIKCLSVIYLAGPERVARNYFIKALITQFIQRKEVFLFLRTEELTADWQKTFPKSTIKCLPSLEMPTDCISHTNSQLNSKFIKFGIIGQVRVGKSIEWLVPLFQQNPTIGKLTIAGAFANSAQCEVLTMLHNFEGFQDKFLTEEELLRSAASQDYLLMLYDNWDSRMESAIMFVAARVNRPVIVYDKGWAGRMVRTYGNGILVSSDVSDFVEFLKNLPKPVNNDYQKMIDGVAKFRTTYSGVKVRDLFLREIFHDEFVAEDK